MKIATAFISQFHLYGSGALSLKSFEILMNSHLSCRFLKINGIYRRRKDTELAGQFAIRLQSKQLLGL